MDDVLIFAQDQEQMTDIYVFLENELSLNYHLKLNLNKTETGRFATKSFDFCGWEFTGEYVRIKQKKNVICTQSSCIILFDSAYKGTTFTLS